MPTDTTPELPALPEASDMYCACGSDRCGPGWGEASMRAYALAAIAADRASASRATPDSTEPKPESPAELADMQARSIIRETMGVYSAYDFEDVVECVKAALATIQASAAPLARPVSGEASDGLPMDQEPKYTVTGSAIINRASGEAIPADEPVFIFRARDKLAARALTDYLVRIQDSGHFAAVSARLADFVRFADRHPERMKSPDTAAPTSTPSENNHG